MQHTSRAEQTECKGVCLLLGLFLKHKFLGVCIFDIGQVVAQQDVGQLVGDGKAGQLHRVFVSVDDDPFTSIIICFPVF